MISTEIQRLQTAKSDLATSIANKGVTVPASATLDDYAALVDSIQTGGGGGVSLFDEMSNYMYIVTPNGSPYKTPYALLYNFEVGKSYKIIAKAKKTPTDNLTFFAYQGNANSPSVSLGLILSPNEIIKEVTYTHSQSSTFTRIGIWATASAERSYEASCSVYIKELG